MNASESAALNARLEVIESLLVMMIGNKYVPSGLQGLSDLDQDCRRWHAALCENNVRGPLAERESAASRMMLAILENAADRVERIQKAA